MLLKVSTAQTVVIGPILDADGAAVTTAVVTDISIAKNGSAAALTTETLTHLANGYYTLALTSGNTNTLGNLEVFVNNTAMSMTVFRYNVIAAQVYDSLVSGSDLLQVDIAQLENSATNAARILIGSNSNHEVEVTISNHVAANIHALQTGVIKASDFAAGAIDATVLAVDCIGSSQISASAVTEIQSGLASQSSVNTLTGYVDTEVSAIKVTTDKLDTALELDGVVYRYTTNALEQAPTGGSTTVNVTPLSATEPDRITPSGIQTLINDLSAIGPIAIKDSSGNAVSLAGLTLKVCIERIDGTVLANLTPTISGASNNQVTFTPNADSVAKTGTFRWALRQVSDGRVYGLGEFIVDSAAKIAP